MLTGATDTGPRVQRPCLPKVSVRYVTRITESAYADTRNGGFEGDPGGQFAGE